MVEWLKEQVLFDHLLHGLFKFLNENTSIKKLRNEVEGSSRQSCIQNMWLEGQAEAFQFVGGQRCKCRCRKVAFIKSGGGA